jgi:hypothetical protein
MPDPDVLTASRSGQGDLREGDRGSGPVRHRGPARRRHDPGRDDEDRHQLGSDQGGGIRARVGKSGVPVDPSIAFLASDRSGTITDPLTGAAVPARTGSVTCNTPDQCPTSARAALPHVLARHADLRSDLQLTPARGLARPTLARPEAAAWRQSGRPPVSVPTAELDDLRARAPREPRLLQSLP